MDRALKHSKNKLSNNNSVTRIMPCKISHKKWLNTIKQYPKAANNQVPSDTSLVPGKQFLMSVQ